MEPRPAFLTANWNKLIMANYEIDPAHLQPWLPAHTELDPWQGQYYVSLVGFLFDDVRLRGLRIPFHTRFPEVNLRFYVRYRDNGEWKRGVVFIREIVPKPAIVWVANSLFRERYLRLPMQYGINTRENGLEVCYQWKYSNYWHSLEVLASHAALPLRPESKEAFITEHYWGYTAMGKKKTGEYQVKHPVWNMHPVKDYRIDCRFGELYGSSFSHLNDRKPASVFLAEGSAIEVFSKKEIR